MCWISTEQSAIDMFILGKPSSASFAKQVEVQVFYMRGPPTCHLFCLLIYMWVRKLSTLSPQDSISSVLINVIITKSMCQTPRKGPPVLSGRRRLQTLSPSAGQLLPHKLASGSNSSEHGASCLQASSPSASTSRLNIYTSDPSLENLPCLLN